MCALQASMFGPLLWFAQLRAGAASQHAAAAEALSRACPQLSALSSQKAASAVSSLANGTSPAKTPAASKARSRLASAAKTPTTTSRATRGAAKTPVEK